MAIRDILVLNTTASRAETQQGSDTVVIKGDSGQALSVENSSGVSVLSVNTVSSSVDVAGKITATGNITASSTSTGSFGRIEATTLVGSAFDLSNSAILGTISSSGQIANQISGAFRQGFEFTGTIGDTIPDQQNKITASFGRIVATSLSGSAANLVNSQKTNTISSSTQIASQISGAFTSGFEFDGIISGSANSTGSFARIDAITLAGDGTELTNIASTNTISGSAQIASQISGAFTSGFSYQGTISGSGTSTGSFGRLEATTLVGDVSGMGNLLKTGIVSGSAQLATAISGSFISGFEYVGVVSGSLTSTGSFNTTTVGKAIGNISNMTNLVPPVVISGSKQIASNISGSFNKGFEFSGTIKTALGSWSAGGSLNSARSQDGGVGTKAAFIATDSSAKTEIYNGSSWSEVNDMNAGRVQVELAGSSTSALAFGGFGYPMFNRHESEEWNGTNWSVSTGMPISRSNHSAAGQTDADSALAFGGLSNSPFPSPTDIDTVEWNGSSWTTYSETGLAPACRNGVGFGSTEAALYSNSSTFNKEWNGTAWSSISNTTITHDKGSGGGTVNDGVVFGGSGGGQCTELYDGTAWSAQGALSAARVYTDGGGTVAGNVLAVGAQSTPQSSTVEHFSLSVTTGSFGRVEATSMHGDISNMTDTAKPGFLSSSAQIADQISGSFKGGISTTGGHIGYGGVWSVGGVALDGGGSGLSLTTMAMFGNNNAAGLATGNRACAPWAGTYTEFAHYQYNGTNWSQSPHHLNYSRGGSLAVGQQEAAFRWGGGAPGSHPASECYNGSAWTQQSEMVWHNSSIGNGFGESSNAAAQFGGSVPTYYCENKEIGISSEMVNCFHQEWDGTSWFIMPGNKIEYTLGGYGGSGGTVNSAFFYTTPHQMCAHKNNPKMFETWDGISWKQETKVPPKLLNHPVGFGTANDAVIAGGTYIPYYPAAYTSNSQEDTYAWDGVSWKVDGAKMNQPRQGADAVSNFGGGVGTSNALAGGGGMHPGFHHYCNQSEHYDRGNGIPTTGSFFEVTASSAFSADLTLASGISFPIGTLSGSAQIANRVSGSFNQRYVFDGNFGGGGGTWYATGLRNNQYEVRYGVGGGTVNAGWLAGGTHGTTSEHYWEKFDGMSWTEAGSNMLKPRCGVKGGGAQNAGIAFGGNHGSPSVNHSTCTEEMNGITWSEVNDLSTGKGIQQGGWGEQTAALSIGGDSSPSAVTEQYDGLNWSNQVSTPHPITQYYDGTGTVNAGGQFVGTACGPVPTSPNYYWNEWNGSTWSEGNKNISPKEHFAMFGKADSAVIYGGRNANTGGGAALVEEYDGTGWSILSSLPRKNSYTTGNGIGGSSAAGIAAGGQWNGGNWTVYKGLPVTPTGYPAARYMNLSFGFERNLTCVINTHTASIADEPFMQNRYSNGVSASIDSEHHNECSRIGNVTADTLQMKNNTDIQVEESMQMPIFYSNPPVTSSAGEVWYNATEEKLYFTYDVNSWSVISNPGTNRSSTGLVGTTGAGLSVGGDDSTGSPYGSVYTELFDGTSWTELNDTNEDQAGQGLVGTAFGAFLHSGMVAQGTEGNELWNGTNWSAGPDGGIGVGGSKGSGTANASIHTGGQDGSSNPHDDTAEWNGTSFSVGGLMPANRGSHAQAGTQNAAYAFGGRTPTTVADSIKYNGTSWSTDADLPTATRAHGGSGTSNAALSFGGTPSPTYSPLTHEYNGTSWHQSSPLNQGKYSIAGAGTQASTIATGGGFVSPPLSVSEIYTT